MMLTLMNYFISLVIWVKYPSDARHVIIQTVPRQYVVKVLLMALPITGTVVHYVQGFLKSLKVFLLEFVRVSKYRYHQIPKNYLRAKIIPPSGEIRAAFYSYAYAFNSRHGRVA